MTLKERFDAFDEDYLKFDRVESPLHARPDLCAFLLLDKLVPGGTSDMVCSAEHDEIFLSTDPEVLHAAASDADIQTLVRCGVRYDDYVESLAMFA